MARPSWTGKIARAASVWVLVLASSALAVVVSPPAGAATGGYVRLAHLSPGTPKVDVYVTSFRGGSFSKVLRGVSYGMVSPYERVVAGVYTVAMRLAGADPDTPPVLSTNVTVDARQAFTVAGIGAKDALKLRVLRDQLTQPGRQKAAVRVVQASSTVPVVDVVTSTGMRIVSGATFPSTTRYLQVPAQRWMLEARRHGSDEVVAQRSVDLHMGAIQTVLVLDGAKGVQLLVTTDAAGGRVMPAGSVAAGLGGAASAADRSPTGRSPFDRSPLVAALLLVAAGLTVTAARAARR